MITNLLEAVLKENSNQFSEVFEELMAEKLAAKVEETLQEHFEANSELFENRGLYQKIKVGDKITYKGYPNPHTPAKITDKSKFGTLHITHEDGTKGKLYTTDITSHNGTATKNSVEK